MDEAWIHDLLHEILHRANQQAGESEFHEIGHVIEYDPVSGMVRCILPSKRGAEDNGNDAFLETGWCQLGSAVVGNGWGLQYHLKGGATQENPELGEQVQISIQNVDSGLRAVANLTFNSTMPPPGSGNDPNADGDVDNPTGWDGDPNGLKRLQPGEFLLRHESGGFFKFYQDGSFQIFSPADLHVYTKGTVDLVVREGDLNATIEEGSLNAEVVVGDANVNVEVGDAAIDVGGDTLISSGGSTAIEAGGSIEIDAATSIEIASIGPINILSGIINAGTAVFQALCNLTFLEKFNAHTHLLPDTTVTSPPIVQAVPGEDTTVNLEAS